MSRFLRSDALQNQGKPASPVADLSSITINTIAIIERHELQTQDLISMIFLLYDAPDVALQQLLVFERISRDNGGKDLNLLYDWARTAQTRANWRHEFLEALAVCQLYKIIKRLGFHVPSIKKMFPYNDIHAATYLNPMKRALYKLCDNMTSDYLERLQNTLKTYDHNTTEYNHCELVLLDLMCKQFIVVNNLNDVKTSEQYFEIDNLANIIDNFPKLKMFATDLRQIANKYNVEQDTKTPVTVSSSTPKTVQDEPKDLNDNDKFTASAFDDLYKYLNQLNMEDPPVGSSKMFKSDTKKVIDGAYEIKNPKRIGVCYIINQEEFHPSKASIEGNIVSHQLDKRLGSNKDKIVLEKTMALLNFEVICHSNLNHKKMIEYIKDIIQYRVHYDDSIFMLCILSHGVRGHVYASDSVKIKIEDIQNLLDEGFQKRELHDIPKVMILQACQVNIDESNSALVADAPPKFHMRKSHFLIYWATAPELEAYRHEKKGSIFIQILCYLIQKYASYEHLYDIFTKVTDTVASICTSLERDQIPIFESTLRKKIYLKIPE